MTRGLGLLSASIAALIMCAACTVDQSATPPATPAGPSDFAQSVSMTATPDNLTQDGASQSSIVVRILDAKAQPSVGVPIRLEILSGGQVVDFGSLSTKSIVTGTDGRAVAVYTAPPAPPATAGGTPSRVTIRATPLGNNAQGDIPYTVDIRLVPTGVILPPAGTPTASFVVSPSVLTAGVAANFDASASTPGTGATSLTSYVWSFGDGTSGSGQRVTHTYTTANTFNVTLTVTNDRGVSASATQVVISSTPALPNALFNFSPTQPGVGEQVFFNASASTAAVGRTIASYAWAFGDGATASGVTTSHAYSAAGTYTVTLVVTDDLGGRSTTTQTLAPGSPPGPQARFTVSPAAPVANQPALFVASTSTTAQGQTIVEFFWNFGDDPNCPVITTGSPGTCYVRTTSPTISHTFTKAGTYAINLTVRDSAGRTGSANQTVTIATVGATAPTPSFTFSPSSPGVNETVFFNASTSVAGAGHNIVAYAWTFGDGGTAAGVTTSHAYATAGTYSVQLKVTDETGQNATTPATTITVGQPPAPTAVFTFSPSVPVVGQTVIFDAAQSRTGQGQTIVKYEWNFGDGTPITTCPGNPACDVTNRTISHVFNTAQTYIVNLVITDSAGRIGAAQIQNVPVAPANPSVSVVLVKSGALTVQATATAQATGTATITNFTFFWGDSTSTNAGTANQSTRTYTANGTYQVQVTVTDSNGRQASASASVTFP